LDRIINESTYCVQYFNNSKFHTSFEKKNILCSPGIEFINVILNFFDHISLIANNYTFLITTKCINLLYESFFEKLFEKGLLDESLEEKQFLLIVSTIRFLKKDLFSEIRYKISNIFNRSNPIELKMLYSKISIVDSKLIESYNYIHSKKANLIDEYE
jgi:hypothetical protein